MNSTFRSKFSPANFGIWPPFFKDPTQKFGPKIRSSGNTTPILKISDGNIEKLKSLRLFGGVNFAFIANRDISNFDPFGSFFTLVFTFQLILSYRLQRICTM